MLKILYRTHGTEKMFCDRTAAGTKPVQKQFSPEKNPFPISRLPLSIQ